MTTNTIPDVPIPAGVTKTDEWQEDAPLSYRVLFGELRNTGGVKFTTVQATAVQFADGRIDDGSVHEAPHVYLGDDALTSGQARDLAAALIETADEVDRWAAANRCGLVRCANCGRHGWHTTERCTEASPDSSADEVDRWSQR